MRPEVARHGQRNNLAGQDLIAVFRQIGGDAGLLFAVDKADACAGGFLVGYFAVGIRPGEHADGYAVRAADECAFTRQHGSVRVVGSKIPRNGGGLIRFDYFLE